jgi:hypothetical protein
MDRLRVGGDELEADGLRRRGGAVLHRQDQIPANASQIEVRVPEGVQVRRATQALAGLRPCGDVLARVMNEDDRHVVTPLQLAQTREQLGDLGGAVLVDGVQTDQWIEQQQTRAEPPDGLEEPRPIGTPVQTKTRHGDDVELRPPEVDHAVPGKARRTLSHRRERILGEIDERGAGLAHGIHAQRRRSRRDAHRQLESQVRFTALRETRHRMHMFRRATSGTGITPFTVVERRLSNGRRSGGPLPVS